MQQLISFFLGDRINTNTSSTDCPDAAQIEGTGVSTSLGRAVDFGI
jgi:hypothetical protein